MSSSTRAECRQPLALWCVVITIGLAMLAAAEPTSRQEPSDVVFEVASIKPNRTPADVPRSGVRAGGRYQATRLSLHTLILTAYQIEAFQLVGGPAWMRTERFDITAVATDELTVTGENPTLPGALQALINERFGLVAHDEIRDFPAYALRVVAEGRLGAGLSPSPIDCAAVPVRERTALGIDCRVSAPGATGEYFAASAPISRLVTALRAHVDRPVIDETGLNGNFSIRLKWDRSASTLSLSTEQSPGELLPASTEGGSIFAALRDQLGLTLEATLAPFKVLVVDSVHYPEPD